MFARARVCMWLWCCTLNHVRQFDICTRIGGCFWAEQFIVYCIDLPSSKWISPSSWLVWSSHLLALTTAFFVWVKDRRSVLDYRNISINSRNNDRLISHARLYVCVSLLSHLASTHLFSSSDASSPPSFLAFTITRASFPFLRSYFGTAPTTTFHPSLLLPPPLTTATNLHNFYQ